MAGTQNDDREPRKPAPNETRQARQAEALRANLRRRKEQSRGRAEVEDKGATPAD